MLDSDETETLGLGQMVDRVAALSKAAEAKIEFMPIPKGAMPPGAIVENPHILVSTDGRGAVKIEDIGRTIEALRGKPSRRKGTATATTLTSFCDLVNRNGDDASLIFVDADWRAPKLTAVLNYHRPADASADADIQPEAQKDGDDPLARFGDHRVVYAFPLSEPWKVWLKRNGELMPQEDFARFVEEHIHEIAGPDTDNAVERGWERDFRTKIAAPSELIDLARGLEINVGAKIKTKTRLQTGETTMVFETEHRTADGQEVTVPGLFILRVPIFYEGQPQRMLVRLRYRPAGEKGVLWAYELFRPDEVVTARVRDDVREVAHQTGRDVIDGAPEAGA